jgi:hypothetical protein
MALRRIEASALRTVRRADRSLPVVALRADHSLPAAGHRVDRNRRADRSHLDLAHLVVRSLQVDSLRLGRGVSLVRWSSLLLEMVTRPRQRARVGQKSVATPMYLPRARLAAA